jgi:2-methylisocitrate lyase-like PEP mutase family enzyme
MTSAQISSAQKASRLLELHHGSQPLVLINAWDAASAAMVEHCGLPAVATSSAALANALGFADGQHLPWEQMLEAVARICRAVKVPVTADIEAGFAPDVKGLETSITQIIQAGAVGVNLEDAVPADLQNSDVETTSFQNNDRQNAGLKDPDLKDVDLRDDDLKETGPESAGLKNPGSKKASATRHGSPLFPLAEQIARIQAVRRAAQAAGIHLVINARTDAYWQSGIDPAEAMRGTLERGKAYLQAGADCIFIPGLRNPEHIKTVIDHLSAPDLLTNDLRNKDLRANDLQNNDLQNRDLPSVHRVSPVNILAGPGVPSIPELAKLGVKRVSYGSGPHRAAMGLLRRMAEEARTSGTYTALTEGAVPYEEMNGLMGS